MTCGPFSDGRIPRESGNFWKRDSSMVKVSSLQPANEAKYADGAR